MAESDVSVRIYSIRIEGGFHRTITESVSGTFYSDGHTIHHNEFVYRRPALTGSAGGIADHSEAFLYFWEGTFTQQHKDRGWWIGRSVGGSCPLAYFPISSSQPASLLWHGKPSWRCPHYAPPDSSLATRLQSNWYTVIPPPPTGLPIPVLAYKTALQSQFLRVGFELYGHHRDAGNRYRIDPASWSVRHLLEQFETVSSRLPWRVISECLRQGQLPSPPKPRPPSEKVPLRRRTRSRSPRHTR